MRFLFVDRILASESGKTISGVKFVTAADSFLVPNAVGELVLLPAVIAETAGQLAAWNIMHAVDFKLRPVAGITREVKIYGVAKLGDSLLLRSWIEEITEDAVTYRSEVRVGEKLILTIENAIAPLLPMQDFIAESVVREQYARLYRPGDFSEFKNKPTAETAISNESYQVATAAAQASNIDQVLEQQTAERIVAIKNISGLAEYFSDHFPNKPVYPLSLLIQTNIQLAQTLLLQQVGDEASEWHLASIRRMKISEFIQPGDQIQLDCNIHKDSADSKIFRCQTILRGQRICSSEAVFIKSINFNHGN